MAIEGRRALCAKVYWGESIADRVLSRQNEPKMDFDQTAAGKSRQAEI